MNETRTSASVASDAVQVVATITTMDAGARKATVAFGDGSSSVVFVHPDIEPGAIALGDQVLVQVTKSAATLIGKPRS